VSKFSADRPHPNPSPKGEGLKQNSGPEGEGLSKRPIVLAVIIGAHGIAGEVRLKLFGDGVAGVKPHRAFNNGALTLEKLRDDAKGGAIARFAEITDRTAAEKARGTELWVTREALPALADGEYYYADLIGLAAVSTTGEDLGVCVAVENYGAGDVLEIERTDKQRFMVPMKAEAVPEWDAARLVIDAGFVA
jgi:16S rRNA processing protein RimM